MKIGVPKKRAHSKSDMGQLACVTLARADCSFFSYIFSHINFIHDSIRAMAIKKFVYFTALFRTLTR